MPSRKNVITAARLTRMQEKQTHLRYAAGLGLAAALVRAAVRIKDDSNRGCSVDCFVPGVSSVPLEKNPTYEKKKSTEIKFEATLGPSG